MGRGCRGEGRVMPLRLLVKTTGLNPGCVGGTIVPTILTSNRTDESLPPLRSHVNRIMWLPLPLRGFCCSGVSHPCLEISHSHCCKPSRGGKKPSRLSIHRQIWGRFRFGVFLNRLQCTLSRILVDPGQICGGCEPGSDLADPSDV